MKTMMKLLITICLCEINVLTFAQIIPISRAKEIAINQITILHSSDKLKSTINQQSISFDSIYVIKNDKDTAYYICNLIDEEGFVIVSADERIQPILGYSFHGKYNENILPPAFRGWMDSRKREFAYVRSHNILPDKTVLEKWGNLKSAAISSSFKSVGPLIQTKWSQDCYYNELCPYDEGAYLGYCNHTPTGCVATAMAQVMKYWNYPTIGEDSNYYSNPIYGTQRANFGSTVYKWAQMPNSVTSSNHAVATLMFHCGVSTNMNYRKDGSGAATDFARGALVNYFNYSSEAEYIERKNYSTEQWGNILKSELDAGRPILFCGGGHAFVIHGYKSSDLYTINWGWGGSCDDDFYLGNFNPTNNDFNNDQEAIIKIFPNPELIDSIIPLQVNYDPVSTELNKGGVDYYKFQVNISGTYIIQTHGNTDTYLYLYQSDKSTIIAEDDNSGEGNNALISYSLNANTWYYIKVKGKSSEIIGAYSIEVADDGIFTFSDSVFDIDANSYSVVKIGSQIWMGENLKTTRFKDGTLIPLVKDSTEWKSLTTPGYCFYNNDEFNKPTFGALYNWYTVNTKKLCPDRWHVPTNEEWTILTDYVGNKPGKKLKSRIEWASGGVSGTDDYNFSALPGGYLYSQLAYSFSERNSGGHWWTSSFYGNDIRARSMYFHLDTVFDSYYSKNYGLSVRCICNAEVTSSTELIRTSGIKLFPNPTTGIVEISVNKLLEKGFKIEVCNNLGSLMQSIPKSQGEKSSKIDLTRFSSGIYMIKVTTKDKTLVCKIVKE
jgi:uncharacterized protein (TIGR02145 family)